MRYWLQRKVMVVCTVLQFEREDAGALTKVLDKFQLHALFPLVALEAGLPRVLQVPSAQSLLLA